MAIDVADGYVKLGNYKYIHLADIPDKITEDEWYNCGTYLGHANGAGNHVHFEWVMANENLDPLADNGITPFSDGTAPIIEANSIRLFVDGTEQELDPDFVYGDIDIVAEIRDLMDPGFSSDRCNVYKVGFEILGGDPPLDLEYRHVYNNRWGGGFLHTVYTNDSYIDGDRNPPSRFFYYVTNYANDTFEWPRNGYWRSRSVPDGKYTVRVHAVDRKGNEATPPAELTIKVDNSARPNIKRPAGIVPKEYAVSDNYPNPFNPTTVIKYQLPDDSRVTIKIYDVIGREVSTLVDEVKVAGYYEVQFIASSLASGVYFYRVTAGKYITVKKMIVME